MPGGLHRKPHTLKNNRVLEPRLLKSKISIKSILSYLGFLVLYLFENIP